MRAYLSRPVQAFVNNGRCYIRVENDNDCNEIHRGRFMLFLLYFFSTVQFKSLKLFERAAMITVKRL